MGATGVYESEQRIFPKTNTSCWSKAYSLHTFLDMLQSRARTTWQGHATMKRNDWSFPNRLIMLARHMHQLTIPCITWQLALPQRKTSHMAMLMLMSSLQPIQNYSIHNHFQQLPATGVTMINIAWLLCWSLQWYAVKFYRTSKWAEEKSIPLSLCNQAYINNKHRQPGRSTRYSAVTQQLH